MEPTLTIEQAFQAMRYYVAQFNEREPLDRRETIDQILAWTERESDGGTFDPAQWDDWQQSVALAIRGPLHWPPESH